MHILRHILGEQDKQVWPMFSGSTDIKGFEDGIGYLGTGKPLLNMNQMILGL